MFDDREWLEADGQGGFAMGPVTGPRRRRYHGLLVAAARPPQERIVLVNGCEATVLLGEGDGARAVALNTQRYQPGVDHPAEVAPLEAFESEPWPRWRFRLPDGSHLVHELCVQPAHGASDRRPVTALTFRREGGAGPARLLLRPLLSGRDFHALHHENPAFAFVPALALTDTSGSTQSMSTQIFRPYPGVPAITLTSNGRYEHRPAWYRAFLYEDERARGLDDTEDLAAPGELWFDLVSGPAELRLAAGDAPLTVDAAAIFAAERARRATFPTPLHRAADAYVVQGTRGLTVIAGYPWFGDWGRDTFIALRGLCLTTGRVADAAAILEAWAAAVSEGMLPNLFPDRGAVPEYNSVDAALWFVVAAYELLSVATGWIDQRRKLVDAVEGILRGYASGTRHGIGVAADGLLAAGLPRVPGLGAAHARPEQLRPTQLTWMDAAIGERVFTPRVGKPVEVQALWLNALRIGALLGCPSAWRWAQLERLARRSFEDRFWNPAAGHLHDVVDVDHRPGAVDPTLRPNQILAVGGLPFRVLDGERAASVVTAVDRALCTPLGLRTLPPGHADYHPRYEGGPASRDAAYHQGSAWPWLLDPFVAAWLHVRGHSPAAQREARSRFLAPLRAHLLTAGLGHVSEIVDAEPPHTPRGCPFQAWSLSALLRLERMLAPPS